MIDPEIIFDDKESKSSVQPLSYDLLAKIFRSEAVYIYYC